MEPCFHGARGAPYELEDPRLAPRMLDKSISTGVLTTPEMTIATTDNMVWKRMVFAYD